MKCHNCITTSSKCGIVRNDSLWEEQSSRHYKEELEQDRNQSQEGRQHQEGKQLEQVDG